jgi:hypothetical protein
MIWYAEPAEVVKLVLSLWPLTHDSSVEVAVADEGELVAVDEVVSESVAVPVDVDPVAVTDPESVTVPGPVVADESVADSVPVPVAVVDPKLVTMEVVDPESVAVSVPVALVDESVLVEVAVAVLADEVTGLCLLVRPHVGTGQRLLKRALHVAGRGDKRDVNAASSCIACVHLHLPVSSY